MAYELIEVRIEAEKVGIITLNRPKALNALNSALMDELGTALKAFDADEAIGCMIITGSEKAFAAGADISAMAKFTFADVYKEDFITRNWETIRSIRKPVIAAVAGFALGGGCELAMMCDFMIAADNAKFGPAGDQDRDHPWRGRHPAPAQGRGQVQGDGHGAHRPHDGRHRGRARRAGQPRGAAGQAHGRSAGRRAGDLRPRPARHHGGQGKREPLLRERG
jgi:hypothetical protein